MVYKIETIENMFVYWKIQKDRIWKNLLLKEKMRYKHQLVRFATVVVIGCTRAEGYHGVEVLY